MIKEAKLKLVTSSGKVIEIPLRLSADVSKLDTQDFDPAGNLSLAQADNLLGQAAHTPPAVAAVSALKAAFIFGELRHLEQTILSLGIYVDKRVNLLVASHEEQQAVALVTDCLVLTHTALPYAKPEWVRDLTQQMAVATETVLGLFAPPLSFDLFAVVTDVITVLNVAQVIWEPALKPHIDSVAQRLSALSGGIGKNTQVDWQGTLNQLFAIQANIATGSGHRVQSQRRLSLLKHLVDATVETARKALAQNNSSVQPHNTGNLGLDRISSEVQELIRQVEWKLRTLIAEKYEMQFGTGWIKHIASKHQQMYSSWMHNMQKDRTVFQAYQEYDPKVLEYSRLQDLTELIGAQWHLFRTQLDFGAEKRNRAIFSDKMQQIAQVRNPLAHHRSIPEIELLRAKVLCTDILIALAQAGRASTSF